MKKFSILILFTLLFVASCGEGEKKQGSNEAGTEGAFQYDKENISNAEIYLVQSAEKGDYRAVKGLLETERANATSIDDQGRTALMAASGAGHEDIVKLILDRIERGDKLRLDVADQEGRTAIMHAVGGGHSDIVKLLKRHGSNPNIYNSERTLPVHIAAKRGDIESLKVLLSSSSNILAANINSGDKEGKTPLHIAASSQDYEVSELLLKNGADTSKMDFRGLSPLHYSVILNDKKMISILLTNKANINILPSSGITPLMLAINQHFYDLVLLFLDNGADPNIHNNLSPSPLQIAVSKPSPIIVIRKLVEKGAKLSGKELPRGNVISYAIKGGNFDVVNYLLKSGAKVSELEEGNFNGLLEALEVGDKQIASLLLDKGMSIKVKNREGYSPLALAMQKGFLDLTTKIIKKGGNINEISSNSNATPLEIIFDRNSPEMLDLAFKSGLRANADKILLRSVNENKPKLAAVAFKNGARANISDATGHPLIWLAVANGRVELTKLLLEQGVRLDVFDKKKGSSPLHMAIVAKKFELVELLLTNQARTEANDNNGLTPLAYAVLTGQKDIIQLLLGRGANVNAKDRGGNTVLQLLPQSKLSEAEKKELTDLLKKYGAK